MSVKKIIRSQEKGGVLVLNSSFVAIGTSPLSRVMLKLSKADSCYVVEEWSTHELNGPQEAYKKPSVVRLTKELDTVVRKGSTSSRGAIYQRDRFTCQFCAKKFAAKDLTLDHVFPRSRGGSNEAINLVAACKPCNNRKGDRTPEEARMPLINSLTSYKAGLHRVQLCHYAESRPEWRKYLFLDSTGDVLYSYVA